MDMPASCLPLVPSLIARLYPHSYTTIGGAPITAAHINAIRGLAPHVVTIWSDGAMLRSARPLPWFVLAACNLVEEELAREIGAALRPIG